MNPPCLFARSPSFLQSYLHLLEQLQDLQPHHAIHLESNHLPPFQHHHPPPNLSFQKKAIDSHAYLHYVFQTPPLLFLHSCLRLDLSILSLILQAKHFYCLLDLHLLHVRFENFIGLSEAFLYDLKFLKLENLISLPDLTSHLLSLMVHTNYQKDLDFVPGSSIQRI